MYIQITDNKLTAYGAYPFDEYTKEVSSVDYDDYTSNPGKYIFQNNTIAKNPNWEEEQELKEKERVARLNMTKLDFVTYIAEYGVTYEQIKQLLASNEDAQTQWELCERVYRFNPLLDSLASALNITPAQLDTMFKKANGEVV